MPIRGPQSVDVGVRKHPPSRRSAPNPGGLTEGADAHGAAAAERRTGVPAGLAGRERSSAGATVASTQETNYQKQLETY